MSTKRKQSTPKITPLRQWRSLLPCPARTSAWVAILTFVFVTGAALTGRDRLAASEPTLAVQTPRHINPTELNDSDRALYPAIFAAQTQGDFKAADRLIGSLANRNLVGHVLAKRYLETAYAARNEELSLWLHLYSDHPEAAQIASMAVRRGLNAAVPKREEPLKGEGYSDHLGRSGMPDSWYTALTLWREGKYDDAGERFAKLSENENLSPWQRAAAYYWSYRAADKAGDSERAETNLKQAAAFNTTFYGLLAAQQLDAVNIVAEAPEVSDSLRRDGHTIRATLLAQLGRTSDAEDELRALYSATAKGKRPGIVTIASELNLSNLQMRLARTPGLSESGALYARFPMPQFMVELHPVMDSALLLAVARNESNFRIVAQSPAGAMGMMQMLPSTARAVERQMGQEFLSTASVGDAANQSIADRLSNPALSARYGAEYLKLLTKQEAIGTSMIHLLVGYNAGPGTVASWNSAARNVSDPLLYIESIPYGETRNYVMQVLAQYWTYQLMMDEKPRSLAALSKGEWPQLAMTAAQ